MFVALVLPQVVTLILTYSACVRLNWLERGSRYFAFHVNKIPRFCGKNHKYTSAGLCSPSQQRYPSAFLCQRHQSSFRPFATSESDAVPDVSGDFQPATHNLARNAC
jgi:hypothetical protein